MGIRNYLIEGLSGTGKTSVAAELQQRGFEAIHGDRELAYQGDPCTGRPLQGGSHENHIWNVDRVRALTADNRHELTFFCGGSRNFEHFIELFDDVFVLHVDLQTLTNRLDLRPDAEWGADGPPPRERIIRWHETGQDVPQDAIEIDATRPLLEVVDAILRHVHPQGSVDERVELSRRPARDTCQVGSIRESAPIEAMNA